MKRFISLVCCLFAIVIVLAITGCSEEAQERVGNAKNALMGEDDAPDVVKKQRRDEKKRQNSTWTLENQAKYPVEYCQAQLKELGKYVEELNVQQHRYAVAKNQTIRLQADEEARVKTFEVFLSEAKTAYKKAEVANQWPIQLSGYDLSQTAAQTKIIEIAESVKMLKKSVARRQKMITTLEQRIERVLVEQRHVQALKEQLQSTLRDLELKQVIESDQGIKDSLNAINDSLQSLGVDYEEPTIEDLVRPHVNSANKRALFEEIMAQ